MKMIRTAIKAGGLNAINHNLKVRTALKSGGLNAINHNLKVRTALKSGGLTMNHSGSVR